jgi:hypothetical protein
MIAGHPAGIQARRLQLVRLLFSFLPFLLLTFEFSTARKILRVAEESIVSKNLWVKIPDVIRQSCKIRQITWAKVALQIPVVDVRQMRQIAFFCQFWRIGR